MRGIQLGLKLWSTDAKYLPEASRAIDAGLFHYVELLVVPGTDPAPFRDLPIPTIIHVTNDRYGVNIANPASRELNLFHIRSSIEWADLLGSEILILHPGYGELEDAEEFLELMDDRRILIENMPKTGIKNEGMVGYTPPQVIALMDGRFGFCLDLNHAIKAAISLKRDYRTLIREFMSLKPSVFHIADGTLGNEKDEHLHLGDGEYDIRFLKHCIGESVDTRVTFETPRLPGSLEDDLRNRERFLLA